MANILNLSWTQGKAYINFAIQNAVYLNNSDNYAIYVNFNSFVLELVINKDGGSDQVDFETNYQPNFSVVSLPVAASTSKVASSNPGAQANQTVTNQISDPFGRLGTVSEISLFTRWGMTFFASSGPIALSAGTEVPIALLTNPVNNTKSMRLYHLILAAPVKGYTVYKTYAHPTVSNAGTPISIQGGRLNGQSATSVTASSSPTASPLGVLTNTITVVAGSDFILDLAFSKWVEPGATVLITANSSNSANTGGIAVIWIEE